MGKVSQYRPKVAYEIGRSNEDPMIRTHVSGFSPSLPDDINWGVNHDDSKRSDANIQEILSERVLYTADIEEPGVRIADRIGTRLSLYISPAFRDLIEELEPGRHRYFEVQVQTRNMLTGRIEHGTYYWLRPLPVVDCGPISTDENSC